MGRYSSASATPQLRYVPPEPESLISRQIAQHPRVVRIVFDNHQHRVAFRRFVAVIFNMHLLLDRGNGHAEGRSHGCSAGLFRPANSGTAGPT